MTIVKHEEHLWSNHQGALSIFWIVSTIELDDFIQKFDNQCDMQQMCNTQVFSSFMARKGLF
jgi:hypothetical protein